MRRIATLLLLLACLCGARAQSIITATVSVTNGTSIGNTITINGNLRYWTNGVAIPQTQIQTNATASGSATNLYLNYASFGQAAVNVFLNPATTNQIFFKAFPGQALSISFGGSWATVSYSTNTLSAAWLMRAPFSLAGANETAAVETALALYLSDSAGTGAVTAAAPLFANFVALSTAQTITGQKTFNNIGNVYNGGVMTNMAAVSATNFNGGTFTGNGAGLTNLGGGPYVPVNIGTLSVTVTNAFRFANTSGNGLFGMTPLTVQMNYPATGNNGLALNTNQAILYDPSGVTILWYGAVGQFILPQTTICQADFQEQTQAEFQQATISNTFTTGAMNNLFGFQNFQGAANGTLTSGGNADVNSGTNYFVSLSGPSGAFTIAGFAGGFPNRVIEIENSTGQSMTLAHQSGLESTATNRIITGFNADRVFTNNPQFVRLKYDGTLQRWKVAGVN